MAQLIPVEHDPFDMAAMLAQSGRDQLVPPPRNPMAPPQGLADALQGAVKHNADWASLPGRVFQGVQPQTPGQWSEEDEFRRQHLAQTAQEWGPQTAFSEVFWPRTGTNVGGSGFNVGSGMIIPPKEGIRAYHGSPHDFERFDMSKIGTGEGAQAYGHGLYFAENPATAQSYRDTLGGRGNVYVGGKQLPNRPVGNVELAAKQRIDDAARTASGDQSVPDLALNKAIEYADYMRGKGRFAEAHADDVVAKLREWQTVGLKTPSPGRMYEVNINAKPEQFLNYDRPISEQTDAIKSVFDRFGYVAKDKPPFMLNDAANQLAAKEGSWSTAAGARNVSEKLREAGVPGIKYSDQRSRIQHPYAAGLEDALGVARRDLTRVKAQGDNPVRVKQIENGIADLQSRLREHQGTSNYVVFDDKIIDILRKYGVAGLAMLPPAVAAQMKSQLIPVDHDPFAQ